MTENNPPRTGRDAHKAGETFFRLLNQRLKASGVDAVDRVLNKPETLLRAIALAVGKDPGPAKPSNKEATDIDALSDEQLQARLAELERTREDQGTSGAAGGTGAAPDAQPPGALPPLP